jgi:hypothetical protein
MATFTEDLPMTLPSISLARHALALLAVALLAIQPLAAADAGPVRTISATLEHDTTLEEMAEFLERAFPDTRVLVEPRAGGSRHPLIPRLTLRDATLSHALKLITALAPLVQSTTETIGATTVVKLRSTGDELTRTLILPLGPAIDRIAGAPPAGQPLDTRQRKPALDSVLSMIRAVSDQTRSPFGPAQLKVHEETELLIANGSEDQLKVISNALGQASVGGPPRSPEKAPEKAPAKAP